MQDLNSAIEHLKELLAAGNIDVPMLPECAQQVMTLTQDPESDAEQLATIIQRDPSLGGHVMRIANSAAYTPNSNLVSIQQAITRLGMSEISQIALSIALNGKTFKADGYDNEITSIWREALATALWAKEVSRAIRNNVEAAFLCGLLHNIGQAVILQTIATETSKVLDSNQVQHLYDQFEADFNQIVASEWELPNIVAKAMSAYRHIDSEKPEQDLAAIVSLGKQLTQVMFYPDQYDKDTVIDSPALDIINLYPDEISQLMEKSSLIQSTMSTMNP